MTKTYYIQSLKEATPALKEVTALINRLGDEAAPILNLLVDNLGFKMFKSEDGEIELKAPKAHSVWGVRAYSKKLITFNDLLAYLQKWDDSGYEWGEEDLDEVVESIARDPEYQSHVHQSETLIGSHVHDWLESNYYTDDEDGEDEDEDEDDDEDEGEKEQPEEKSEDKKCEGCPRGRVHVIRFII